jgi:hypothetical protein
MNYKRNQKISHPGGVTDYMNCQLVATLKTDVTHNLECYVFRIYPYRGYPEYPDYDAFAIISNHELLTYNKTINDITQYLYFEYKHLKNQQWQVVANDNSTDLMGFFSTRFYLVKQV